MSDLPHWNLAPIYPGLDSDRYRAGRIDYEERLAALELLFDENQIRRREILSQETPAALGELLERILHDCNDLLIRGETLGAFLHALITIDSYNAAAAKENSALELLGTRRQQLDVRLKGWLGALTNLLPELIKSKPTLAEHRFFLTFTAEQSRYLMSEPLEALAAELALDAGTAWGRLQGTVTSQLTVTFDGREMPISMVRNLSFDPDPAVRERAYNVEIAGWKTISSTVAACLNGVKGTALTLNKQRGRASVLELSLEQNRIDRATLDALLGSIREFLPEFRRYFTSKAKKLGHKTLMWWDLFAPIGHAEQRFSWEEARRFIVEKFSTFSPELGAFADRNFAERWIDAEPRAGKRGGAYCMSVPGIDESRILANFDGSFEQLMTLAHELGHAWHNECQTGLPMLRRGSPSTLAETASIFCETLVAESSLATASQTEQLMILEAQLANAAQVCVDISSRYLFETAVMERRPQGELSAEEFTEILHAAQRETYGDAVAAGTYHPYMWLWKPHYYSHDENFYNFPYAFGHLFSLGLYAIFQKEGTSFVPRYNALLRDTAQDMAAPLAERFGLNIREREFWRGSLRVVARMIDRYETL
jgi:oligoendopeptidase F